MTLQQGPHILGARIALDEGDVAKKLTRLSAAFGTLAGGVGLTAAIRAAISEAGQFETALTKVSTLLPPGESAITRYGKAVENMAVKFGQSTTQVADGLFQAISASVSTGRALEFMDVAGKAAVGGFTDLKTVVDGTTSIINAFGVSVGQTQQITDAMFIANRDGKTTVEELSQSLGRVASTAAATGLNYKEMLAIIATGTKVGVQTSEVVSGLKAALAALARPSKEASDLSRELGLQFNEMSVRAYGLTGFLQRVGTATGGSTEKLVKLFGSTEAANLVLSLISEQGLASFSTTLGAMNENLNLTEVNFQRASNTFEFKSRQLNEAVQRSFRAAGIAIVEEFGGDLTTLTGKAEDLEKTVARYTKMIVGHVRYMADNVESIIRTVLLYRVGGMLATFGGKLGTVAAGAASASAAAAAGAASGAASASGTIGPGSILRGFGLAAQGFAVATAVFHIVDALIEANKVQVGGVISDAAQRVENVSRVTGVFGSGGTISPEMMARLGTTERVAAMSGYMSDTTRMALAAASDPTAFLRTMDLSASTDKNSVQRQYDDAKKVNAFNRATGANVSTLDEARAMREEMAKVLAERMPDLVRAATQVTEYRPITGSMEYSQQRLAMGTGLDLPLSGLGITRTQSLDTDALAESIGRALADLPEAATKNLAVRAEEEDMRRRKLAEDYATTRHEFYEDGIAPFISAVADFVGAAKNMVENPPSAMVSIWHKIVDGSKKKNRHSVSLQKRSAAKGLPPRYQAFVVREGAGGLLVEPMPEDLIGPGMNDGGF